MKSWGIFSFLLMSAIVWCIVINVDAKRKHYENDDTDIGSYDRPMKKSKHEYNKYSKEYSEENAQSFKKQKSKSKGRSKKLQLDLDNVNEDELTSDELQVLEYRRKKLERQNKKTLSDVFQEKKQKNKQRKEKFEKNVLKYFKIENDNDNTVSSEELVITPLKRVKIEVADECSSSEEKCP